MQISTSKLEKEFRDESKMRIKKLEDEMEEFKSGITEDNLRLRTPYTTDKSGNGLSFSLPEAENKIMYVYLGNDLVGKITLE